MICKTCNGSGTQCSLPLKFEELSIGETFIAYPDDGDDSGHGGFRRGSYVLRKLAEDSGDVTAGNYVRLKDGSKSHLPASMLVLRVLL